jgi:hypothetical protein
VSLAGAPARGRLERLEAIGPGGSWQATSNAGGAPQPWAMCADGPVRIFAHSELSGNSSVFAENDILLYDIPGGAIGAVARDGDVLVVGQPDYEGGGLVRIYEIDGEDSFVLRATFFGGSGDRLGDSVAVEGAVVVAGAPGDAPNGTVRVYVDVDPWVELQQVDSPAFSQTGARFGASVALAGDFLAIGSPEVDRVTSPGARTDVGAVYVYEFEFLGFELSTLLRPAGAADDDGVGTSIALHDFGARGLVLAIGTPGEDVDGADEGAVHVFRSAGAGWSHAARLVDGNGADGDALGTAVAIGELGVLAGAPFADANGVVDQGAVLYFDELLPVFIDDFENAGTGAWSDVQP